MGNLFKNLKLKQIFLALVILPCLFLMSACSGQVYFKINFVVDGVVYDTVETMGNAIIAMPDDPMKEGYTFDGWYWDKDVWGEPFTANSLLNIPLKKDMNVYARFVSNHLHSMQYTAYKAPTCTEDGNVEYYTCTTCSKKYSDELGKNRIVDTVLKKLGHRCGNWYPEKDATYYESGIERRDCIGCSYYETRELPQILVNYAPTSIDIEYGIIKWNGASSFGFDVIVNGISQVVKDNKLETTLKSDDYNEVKVASIDVDGNRSEYVELKDFIVNAPISNLHYTDDGSNVTFTWDSPNDLYDYTFIVGETENTIDKAKHSYTVARNFLVSGSVVSIYVQGLSSANFYPSKKKTITLQQLNAPNLYIDKLDIKWESVVGADNYKVNALTTETITSTSYSYDGASAGEHTITVTAFGRDYLNNSTALTFNKLSYPEITIENNIVSWNAIAGQVRYATLIDGNETRFIGNSFTITNTEDEYDIYLYATPVQPNTMMSDRVIISKFTYGEYSNVYYGMSINTILTYTKVVYNNYIYVPTKIMNNISLSNVNSSIILIACKVPEGLTKAEIESIIVPDGTTEIVENAFYNCTSLKSVTFEENGKCESIGYKAFCGCTSLTSITIPEGVTSIGESAFSGCTFLTGVYITNLDKWASIEFGGITANPLYYAKNLYLNGELVTDATLINATKISSYTFYGYTSLMNITIPESVTDIGRDAFYGCTSLTRITIPKGVTSIKSYAFSHCTSLTSITIPASVTSIGSGAFDDCTSLKTVTFAENSKCESIGYGAFSGCNSLIEMTLPFVGGSASAANASSSTLFGYIFGTSSYDGGTIIDQHYAGGSYSHKLYYMPSNLRKVTILGGNILYGAFYNCSILTDITIPESVTSIGYCAFSDCTSLTGVYITNLDKWVSINFGSSDSNPLYYAKNLYLNGELVTDATLANVTKISSSAFCNCESLTSITIPESVTSIGYYAFSGCKSLTRVYITDLDKWASINFSSVNSNPLCYAKNLYLNGELVTDATIANVTKISSYAFYGCTSLISITIPKGVTDIGRGTFHSCTALTNITISESVTSIGGYAFYGCISLTSIIIPESVTSIEDFAFSGCTFLTGVYITNLDKWASIEFGGITANPLYYAKNLYLNGELVTDATLINATKISSYTFYGYTSLMNITIPESVTDIGRDAFYGCTSLTNITISESVTSIGGYAFYGCTLLAQVYYEGGESGWNKISIDSYNSYLTNATRYYYSEEKPTTDGNYWHYVDGVVTEW